MEIFDTLNSFIFNHPNMLSDLEFAFRLKWWCLLVLVLVFFYLPAHEQRKKKAKKASLKNGQFLA